LQLLARGPILLDASSHHKVLQREIGPAEQFLAASAEDTLDAYRSVIDYYPDSKLWVARANQRIAVLYLERGYNDKVALEKAMNLFQEFADGSREKDDVAFGLGGEAIVLTFRHEPKESIKKLAELWAFLEKWTFEQRQGFYATPIGQRVQRIAEKNRLAIDKKDLEQFNEALESLSSGEAPGGQTEGTEGKK
jgi:hypothetical protein